MQGSPPASWTQWQPVHHDTAKWKLGLSRGRGLSFFESERGGSTLSPLVPCVCEDQGLSIATHKEKRSKVGRLKEIRHPPWALPGEGEPTGGHQHIASEGRGRQRSSFRRPMFTIHASSCTHPPSISADQTHPKDPRASVKSSALDVRASTSQRRRAAASPKFLQSPYGKEAGTPFATVSRCSPAQPGRHPLQPGCVKDSAQGKAPCYIPPYKSKTTAKKSTYGEAREFETIIKL